MSATILIMRVPLEINSTSDFSTDFVQEPLGSYVEVQYFLRTLFPDADYTNPAWIFVDSNRLSEIIMGVLDPVYGLGFRNPSWDLLQEVYETMGWRGIDPTNGQVVPPFNSTEHYGDLLAET